MCVCWPNLQGTSKTIVWWCAQIPTKTPRWHGSTHSLWSVVWEWQQPWIATVWRETSCSHAFFFLTSRCLCTQCLHGCATKLITMYPCFGWVCPPCSIWVKGILLRFQMLLAASLTRCVWLLRLASTNFVVFLQPVTSLHQQSRSSCYVLIRACWTVASCFMQNVIF